MEKRTLRQWWNNEGGPWLVLGAAVLIFGLLFVLDLPLKAYNKVLDLRDKRRKAALAA
jgi:hypothetical protein